MNSPGPPGPRSWQSGAFEGALRVLPQSCLRGQWASTRRRRVALLGGRRSLTCLSHGRGSDHIDSLGDGWRLRSPSSIPMLTWLPPTTVVRCLGQHGPWAIPLAVLTGIPAYLNGFAAIPLVRAHRPRDEPSSGARLDAGRRSDEHPGLCHHRRAGRKLRLCGLKCWMRTAEAGIRGLAPGVRRRSSGRSRGGLRHIASPIPTGSASSRWAWLDRMGNCRSRGTLGEARRVRRGPLRLPTDSWARDQDHVTRQREHRAPKRDVATRPRRAPFWRCSRAPHMRRRFEVAPARKC